MYRIILCFLIIFCFYSQAQGLEVRFKETATAGSQLLTIGDVAEITPSSKADKLSDVELFPAPGPGEQKCFKSSTLKAYVRNAAGRDESIQWGGAERVCVRPDGAILTPEKLQRVVNQRLEDALSHLSADRVGFEMRSSPEPISIPRGEAGFDVSFSDRNVMDSRKVNVIVKVDGRVVENLSIPGRVRAVVPVAVAAGNLERGDVLKESDVNMKPQNIADLRSPCLDRKDAVGKRVKRSVSAGRALSKSDIDRPVLVKRRQMVSMVLEKGSMRLQARGVAEENGKKGDVIRVKNTRSAREVSCVVTGKKQVRVEF
ncbi:MAG: flagellar basal body P-ring formation chaperone FlgA [Desulfosalsimonas sp.]